MFHDNLITRLKALSHIQSEFEKRTKEAEQRYSDKLNDMRKQLDLRWRQIDKFEASVKTIAEAKATWRKKLAAKEGEIEALQVCYLPDYSLFFSRTSGIGDQRTAPVARRTRQGRKRSNGDPVAHRPRPECSTPRH